MKVTCSLIIIIWSSVSVQSCLGYSICEPGKFSFSPWRWLWPTIFRFIFFSDTLLLNIYVKSIVLLTNHTCRWIDMQIKQWILYITSLKRQDFCLKKKTISSTCIFLGWNLNSFLNFCHQRIKTVKCIDWKGVSCEMRNRPKLTSSNATPDWRKWGR